MTTRPPAWQRNRLTTLIIVSLLLHAFLISGLPIPSFKLAKPSRPLNATLLTAPKSAEPPKPDNPGTTTPAPHPSVQRPNPRPVAPNVTMTVPTALTSPAQPTRLPDLGTSAIKQLEEPVSAPVPPSPIPPPETMAATALIRAVPSASATLQYKVTASDPRTDPPRQYFGSGTLIWKADRETYDIDLQVRVSILFVTINALSSHSEGTLQESGLIPKRYTETPRNRSTLAINFNRDDRNSVTFSASTNSLPLVPGVQDRLTTLLQLGAVVRANPTLMQANGKTTSTIDFNVAGTRGVLELWRFISLGVENVETGIGKIAALHLQRAPRQRADQSPEDQSMDIWLAVGSTPVSNPGDRSKTAPSGQGEAGRQAYPVKIRFADANATGYELTLEKIE